MIAAAIEYIGIAFGLPFSNQRNSGPVVMRMLGLSSSQAVMVVILATTALPFTHRSAVSQSAPTYWLHNGSVMYLVANGESREFYYWQPRPGMLEAGARRDTLLFRGTSRYGAYSGTAYIFNARCGAFPYQVSGPILDGYRRVVMRGQAPRVGEDCRVFGYIDDVLEFSLIPTPSPAPYAVPAPQEDFEAERAAREAAHAKAVEDYKRAAENDPNNKCAAPSTARKLIEDYNALNTYRQVVDIEHLVTLEPTSTSFLVCHGIWVLANGTKLEGTMRYRLNVAGDVLYSWNMESWTPSVPMPAEMPPPPPSGSSSFAKGLADRTAWEEWAKSTAGDFHMGVDYWATERSKPTPGSCAALGGEATKGCEAAKARMTPYDIQGKSDPEYRRGWGSY